MSRLIDGAPCAEPIEDEGQVDLTTDTNAVVASYALIVSIVLTVGAMIYGLWF